MSDPIELGNYIRNLKYIFNFSLEYNEDFLQRLKYLYDNIPEPDKATYPRSYKIFPNIFFPKQESYTFTKGGGINQYKVY